MLKPQMGWSSWNCFREQIDEKKIMSIAQAMQETGLQALGYRYINIDDCWQSSLRDEQNQLQFDMANFPSGHKIITQLQDQGFKVGLYSACSDLTCEDMPGSYLMEAQDAQTFARWGIDYLKYDYCHVVDMPCDCSYLLDTAEIDYLSIANEEHLQSYYLSTEAKLSGEAKLIKNEACYSHSYLTDLNKGTAEFTDITVSQNGTYILTLGFRKRRSEKGSMLTVLVNEQDDYLVHFPRSSGWSETGRQQLKIKLNKGINHIKIFNPVVDQKTDAQMRYKRMGDALAKTQRNIFYSISEHGRTEPWTWASEFANSWRTTPDIEAHWESVYACYDRSVDLVAYQKPGAYHDPDMLQIGNGSLNYYENRSHFALWCFINAPLLLGFDIRKKPQHILEIIKNKSLIAINQDSKLQQAKRIEKNQTFDVLLKTLSDGHALCILNKTNEDLNYDISLLCESYHLSDYHKVQNLWTDEIEMLGNHKMAHRIAGKDCLVLKFFT